MAKGLGILFCVLALVGCNKSSDDNSSGGGGGDDRVQEKSVLGAATKIGVFPDGTAAQPLSDQQMADIGKMAEGAMTINQAINNVTPKSLQRTGDVKVESAQAILQSTWGRGLLGLRAGEVPGRNFEQELRGCRISHSKNPPQESGNDVEKIISWSEFTIVNSDNGYDCPVSVDSSSSVKIHARKLSESKFKAEMAMDMSSRTILKKSEDQLQFDFVSQNINGQVGGEILATQNSQESAINGRFDASLETKTHGNLSAKVLFDLYQMQAVQESQCTTDSNGTGHCSTSSGPNLINMRLSAAVIIQTSAGNLLLQVFAKRVGTQTLTQVYLNGKELKQSNALN